MMDTAVSTALKGKAMDDTDMDEGPQAGHPVAKADSNRGSTYVRRNNARKRIWSHDHGCSQWKDGRGHVSSEGRTVTFEHGKLPYKDHGKQESLLDVALNFGVHLDHACGGNCACTTCHIWVKEGADLISEMEDDEADKLDMAADLQLNSRLGCQTVIRKPGKLVVEIPAWNRNYVSEEH